MVPTDGLSSSSGPGSDPAARPGRQALDLLARDLEGELSETIAGRYVVGERLGHGAHGAVHRAQDRLTGETVAIKLLPSLIETDLVRLRGEIAALRLLRLPGVVHLFDEGTHRGRPFLVMELVEGEPFPGRLPAGETRWMWELLRGPALALLDTLARVHAAGLVHRDLKPRNVLVTAEGRPVLLDFGLTVGRALSDDSASDSRPMGTPAYAAPEQFRGESVDARADLYALGVMLWEALTGRRPHAGDRVSAILRARLEVVAEPVSHHAPALPRDVAEVVDQLLEIDRERRPRSAVEVEERLRGESCAEAEWQPRLVGRDHELRRLVEAAQAGRPACLVGRRGSGRTRLLREAGQRLEAGGRSLLWAQPGSRPFESLAGLSGWIADEEPATLQAALDITADGLRRALHAGVVLVVDGLEQVDDWSRRVLDREAQRGAVLASADDRAPVPWAETVLVGPLPEEALRGLFAGEDRLLHVHDDAAHELWERTAGMPSSLQAEVEGWRRAGLVETAGAQLLTSRALVDRLRGGLNVLPVARSSSQAARALDDDVDELLTWIHLAWPNTDKALLVRISGRTAWLLEAELGALRDAGAVRMLPDGRVRPLRASNRLADTEWLRGAGRSARCTLAAALAPGVAGRLYHLVAGGDNEAAAFEGIAVARAAVRAGKLNDAEVALAEGLRAARRLPAGRVREIELAIFREWLPVALSEVTPIAADRLLYEMGRCASRTEDLLKLERLLQAAIAAYETHGERAMRSVDQVPIFADAALERWRQALRVRSARRCPLAIEVRVVEEACAWARGVVGEEVAASALEWEGRLRYRQGQSADAARLLRESAERGFTHTQRLSALLNAASALLEVPALDDCEDLARRARDEAAQLRLPWFEGRAEWLARAAAYRRGTELQTDAELVRALERVGALVLASIAALTEASIAWRRGERLLAAELAADAVRLSAGPGARDVALLARGLRSAALAQLPADADRMLHEASTTLIPAVGVQVIALLVEAGLRTPGEAQRLLNAARASRGDSARRLEILSLNECADRLAGTALESGSD